MIKREIFKVDLSYSEKIVGKHISIKRKEYKEKRMIMIKRIYSIKVDVQYDESKDQLVVSKTITVDGESG